MSQISIQPATTLPDSLRGPWSTAFSGKRFHPLNLQPDEVNIADIAHALANLCRFGGHCEPFYSVAEHSVHLSKIVPPDMALQALVHDAAEAYSGFGDVLPPAKEAAPLIREIEHAITKVVAQRFEIPWPFPAYICQMDKALAKAESDTLMPLATRAWFEGKVLIEIPKVNLGCWRPDEAEELFTAQWNRLRKRP